LLDLATLLRGLAGLGLARLRGRLGALLLDLGDPRRFLGVADVGQQPLLVGDARAVLALREDVATLRDGQPGAARKLARAGEIAGAEGFLRLTHEVLELGDRLLTLELARPKLVLDERRATLEEHSRFLQTR